MSKVQLTIDTPEGEFVFTHYPQDGKPVLPTVFMAVSAAIATRPREIAELRRSLEAVGDLIDLLGAAQPDGPEVVVTQPVPTGEQEDLTKHAEKLRREGHPEAYCHRCKGPNVSWSAPSPLWNEVMRGGDINGPWQYDEIICPVCFATLAEAQGIAEFWRLTAERVHRELQTVTPSGRVWNERTWLWDEPVPTGEETAHGDLPPCPTCKGTGEVEVEGYLGAAACPYCSQAPEPVKS